MSTGTSKTVHYRTILNENAVYSPSSRGTPLTKRKLEEMTYHMSFQYSTASKVGALWNAAIIHRLIWYCWHFKFYISLFHRQLELYLLYITVLDSQLWRWNIWLVSHAQFYYCNLCIEVKLFNCLIFRVYL